MVSVSPISGGGVYAPATRASTQSVATQAEASVASVPSSVRGEDVRLQGEAARLAAEARLAGGSANAQVSYGIGPDGQMYISSITVTKTVPKESGGVPQSVSQGVDVPQVAAGGDAADTGELTSGERQRLAELQAADVSVRNHEMLHFRTAGGVASGTPEYSLVQGPDGQYYAVAGAVHVHTGSTTDPEQAARNAATLARAALAPGDASAADLQAAKGATADAAASYGKALAAQSGRSAVPTVDFSA